MKCPFCNNDMVSGLLHGRGGGAFFWIPEDEEISIFFNCTVKNVNKKNGIMFDPTAYGGLKYPANVCKYCKKVIFEFE